MILNSPKDEVFKGPGICMFLEPSKTISFLIVLHIETMEAPHRNFICLSKVPWEGAAFSRFGNLGDLPSNTAVGAGSPVLFVLQICILWIVCSSVFVFLALMIAIPNKRLFSALNPVWVSAFAKHMHVLGAYIGRMARI